MKRSTGENIQLHKIIKYIKKDDVDKVKKLLETEDGKLVINSFDNNNINPLILASKKGYTHIIEVLLEKGADFSLENKEGETAIECINEKIKYSNAETVKKFIECKKMLLVAGARIDKPITGVKRQRLLKLPIKYNNIYDTKNECKSWVFGNIITETFTTDVLFMICNRFIYIRPLEKLIKAQFQIFFGFGMNCNGFTTDRIVHVNKGFIFNCNYVSMGIYAPEKYDSLFYKYKSVLNYENTLRTIAAEIIQKNWRRNVKM